MLLAAGFVLFTGAQAIFFGGGGGGGGGGCCCGCGTPQPASCGCQPATQCPPPASCPVCPQQSCPSPPRAYCPQVQPVYVPSCSGSGCGGCGGGGCEGGGYSGGGYATGPTAGYAGGSYASPPLPVVGSYVGGQGGGYGGGGGSYSTGGGGGAYPSGGGGGSEVYSSGGGEGSNSGGFQTAVPASAGNSEQFLPHAIEANAAPRPLASSSNNYAPPLNTKLRSPSELPTCEPKIKYIVLKSRRVPGNEEVMEEAEEVDHPAPVEATASPLEAKEIGDEISRNEASEDEGEQLRAQGATTLSDAKCNSKQLRQLITDNIVIEDALASKRAIHESSLRRFPEATVDVICSGTGFTYLVSTTEHCEAQKDNVICFVYKRPLLRH